MSGYFTLLFAKLVGPSGRVIAFEPDPTNFRLLEENVRANDCRNVVCHNVAVSDRTGNAHLYLNPRNPSDHKLVDEGGRESVSVDVVRLDDALQDAFGQVDWIKMDIQGAELSALEGMASLLDSCAAIGVVTELCPSLLLSFGADPREPVALLEQRGFGLNEIRDDGSLRPISADEALRAAAGEGTYLNLACVKSRRT